MKHLDSPVAAGSAASMVLPLMACLTISALIGEGQGNCAEVRVRERQYTHPVSVSDAIEMTQFGDLSYIRGLPAKYNAVHFSPDGKQFVIVTERGNIKKNTTDYSLLLFNTHQALRSPSPEMLVSLSSSSNRPAIQDIKWVDDHTIAFLGESPGELQQIYKVNRDTKQLTKVTRHSTGVTSYAFSPDGDRFFFLSAQPVEPLFDERSARDGVLISTQRLPDLLIGENREGSELSQVMDLFMKTENSDQELPLRIRGDIVGDSLWLSPNGRYLVVTTSVVHIPENWREYENEWLQTRIRATSASHGTLQMVYQYDVINMESGKADALLDAPVGSGACTDKAVVWSPDSKSVIVSGAYLPLNVSDVTERKLRQSKRMVAEIKIPSLELVRITSREVCPLKWDLGTSKLLVAPTSYTQPSSVTDVLALQQTPTGWKEVELPTSGLAQSDQIAVTLEEDMNTAPKVFVRDIRTQQRSLLLDLNPQFTHLNFGQVQDITFKATDGHTVSAGLYLPPNYERGKRYPLVLQTHKWDHDRFWIDGPYSSAFAAQPLAGRGIAVLQLEEDWSIISTPQEASTEASAYEGAIDYLDGIGIVDRNHVGVIGFSRTGLGVEYALTHSKYHFAAATLAEQSDAGYFAYLSLLPSWSWRSEDFEVINGGVPFGDGLASWINSSPGFNLAKVTTPVREEAYHSDALLFAWEWFAGLSRLGKPVELIYIPGGDHVLVKPQDRVISQQGNVDWFSFWLQGYEDPDPAKAEQYKRWRKLRRQQLNDESESRADE